ncbi:MAG TPA: PilC/PilY family type IV pilus protein [Janthinobacterium sp.]|nr:PilC/PilY family type IV pilus protein [Janthinobacterium sp.]
MKRWSAASALVPAALALLLALPGCMGSAAGAVPAVEIMNGALGLAGTRVPPNLLLNLALNDSAAAAAYPGTGAGAYARNKEYLGYFDPHSCYHYPYRPVPGSAATQPDLAEASGYFSVLKAADAQHECGGDSFSGNFMNWASASTLDILRYALSGGDRVIDKAGLSVLQRAYLPDGKQNGSPDGKPAGKPEVDFYAHPAYFPRKRLVAGVPSETSRPIQVTPFDTPVLYIVSCRNRILFSNSADGGDCDTPPLPGRTDKYFGEFLARVEVCDRTEGPQRTDLCVAYGSRYKPSGALQRYAGTLRLGLMSYLTEHGAGEPNLYGGVLRAPLEHIGELRRDPPEFAAAVNGRPEWSRSNGVLYADPAQRAAGASGLINYVNQLGRATPSGRGRYKSADPLGELYYEALRYVQGRQPSAGAAEFGSDEGFPVFKSWTDPLVAACQRNVFLTIANAGAAGDRYVPGNSRADYLDAARGDDVFGKLAPMNVMAWTRRVGEMEADSAGAAGNPAPRTGLAALELQNTGDAGRGSYYMAGLAYWAHTAPLRADQPARVDNYRVDNYVIDLDFGGNGSIEDSNPRPIKPRNSQLYLAAKYGGFLDANQDGNPFQTSAGASASANSHAEWSAGGDNPAHYFLGGDPAALIAAVRTIFAAAGAASGRSPGGLVMAMQTARDDAYVFQAEFDQGDWSGRLSRLALGVDANGDMQIGAVLWEAGQILSGDSGNAGKEPARAARPAPAQRQIYTAGKVAGIGSATIAFAWNALSEQQRDLLDRPPPSAGANSVRDGLGEQRLNYVRGDRSLEIGQPGGLFRRRGGVLGDAVNAPPLYVGAPSAAAQGKGYDAFYASHQMRRRMVYLGANDGMLHAFDAANGEELFAYIPDALIGTLNELGDISYAHRPYVDGAAGAGVALVQGEWKSVLVSGLGGGAQGVFALDVSDPEHFQAGGALWEFTDRDDAGIGNVMAAPLVARFKTGLKGAVPEYRYFAVVASGLNNYVDDGKGRFNGAGSGALFLLALDKPASAAWTLGVNYYKLVTPIAEADAANGLGPPALVIGGDGAVRYAYAGDLQGNLWRFDFSAGAPWSNSVGPGAGKQPLFVARDGSGRRQPITQQPAVVFAPGGGYLVMFGTGKFIEKADALPENFQPQSFYAVRDTAGDAPAVLGGRAALAPRSLDAGAANDPSAGAGEKDGLTVRGGDIAYSGASAKAGWYVDFADVKPGGERSVSGAVLAAGKVFFNTLLPGSEACGAAKTRTYGLDALTGLAFDSEGKARSGMVSGWLSEETMRGPPVVLEMSAVAGQREATGRATVTKRYVVLNPVQAAGAAAVKPGPAAAPGAKSAVSVPARRISWREVANWRELHDAAIKSIK